MDYSGLESINGMPPDKYKEELFTRFGDSQG